MAVASQLGYLQARLQARHGERLNDAGWRLLEATPDMASYLQAARTTSLQRLISHLPGETGPHTLERSLRQDWRALVEEIARWSPRIWQTAIRWWTTLPYLAPMVHLSRGDRIYPWMRDDPVFQRYAHGDPVARHKTLADCELATVLAATAAGRPPLAAWHEYWLTLLPAGDTASRRALEEMAGQTADDAAPDGAGAFAPGASSALRTSLGQRFLRSFRRHARTPVAVFASLGLSLLEYDRLRRGLVIRAVFPDPARRPRWA